MKAISWAGVAPPDRIAPIAVIAWWALRSVPAISSDTTPGQPP